MTTLQEQRDALAAQLQILTDGFENDMADPHHNFDSDAAGTAVLAFIDHLIAERKATADFLQTVCIYLGREEYAIPADVFAEALKIANHGLPE